MNAADVMKSINEFIAALPIKDIAVNAAGGFVGSALLVWIAFGWTGIKNLRSRFGRPQIIFERKKAPENIFIALELGSSSDWIKQQLGNPNKVSEHWWGYRFSDALVSLHFDQSMALETVAVALNNGNANFPFPSVHFDCPPLGKAMLSHVLVEHLQLEHISARRHTELLVSGREGPTGAWHYITFGALDPLTPGELLPSEFVWSSDENRLITPSEHVKINWAAISSRSEPAHFPWNFALNFQSV